MTDPTELDESLFEDSEGDTDLVKKLRQANRAQKKGLKNLESQNEELSQQVQEFQRVQVFDEVGLSADGPAKLFRDTYQGDLSPEAVRAGAESYGLLDPPAPKVPEAEMQAHAAINMAAQAPPVQPPDLSAQINATQSREELEALLAQHGQSINWGIEPQ